MKRSSFLFLKGLGLIFAILCGVGTAVLGWYDGADWMNIATYSIAVTGLILWGWYHCLLYTSPSPRDRQKSRMPSSA